MIELGQHAIFILVAYAGVFLGVGALAAWTIFDSRRVSRRLEVLGDSRS